MSVIGLTSCFSILKILRTGLVEDMYRSGRVTDIVCQKLWAFRFTPQVVDTALTTIEKFNERVFIEFH